MELFIASAYLYSCFVKQRKYPRPNRENPSICFSGCGIRYHFYGGVAEYLVDNFETDNIDILCVSGGVYAGVILALNRKMTHWCDQDWQKCYNYWSNRSLYIFLDSDKFQRDLWRGYLPVDAYKTCSNRLFITVSRIGIYGFYEEIVSEYCSNEELIDAICGTIHIAGIYRFLPTVLNKYAFDGCYTNLMPRTNSFFPTLLVKLFGRGHVDYGNKLSIMKLMTIVKPEHCNSLINEGYYIASRNRQQFVDCGFIEKNKKYVQFG
jgi:hypothetical protein